MVDLYQLEQTVAQNLADARCVAYQPFWRTDGQMASSYEIDKMVDAIVKAAVQATILEISQIQRAKELEREINGN